MNKILLALAAAVLVAACATTISPTGRTQYVGAVPQEQLDQLGAQAFVEMKSKQPLSNNRSHNAYVSCVVQAIVRELPADQRTLRWESAVFADDSPNAFALPGGKIGVNTGLLGVARDQDQLAAVIAHEVGHVIARHHDERITRQYGAAGALQVVGALLGSRYGEGVGQVAMQGGSIAAQGLFLLPGSRAQETEADVVGQDLMARAGFDPRKAVDLWQNMIAASGGNRPPEWLSTHPNPQARISEMQSRASALIPVYEQARASGRRPACG
ncbi:M48 family metallopeptidase [Luteimonas sp. JM171]|uniref:M48 family metallopeptidase n=1 Tax=Luteimonas sp. JM171 TaxID=1896164 RepID=UPI000857BCCE|nr:M48 family metallopeptidase [Luteimonas sp. JM171]AOH35738.1 peptidase [Luteimonas sp. JM171]